MPKITRTKVDHCVQIFQNKTFDGQILYFQSYEKQRCRQINVIEFLTWSYCVLHMIRMTDSKMSLLSLLSIFEINIF